MPNDGPWATLAVPRPTVFAETPVARSERGPSTHSNNAETPKSLIDLGVLVYRGPSGSHVWWSWGGSNPRPQAIAGQIYMRS